MSSESNSPNNGNGWTNLIASKRSLSKQLRELTTQVIQVDSTISEIGLGIKAEKARVRDFVNRINTLRENIANSNTELFQTSERISQSKGFLSLMQNRLPKEDANTLQADLNTLRTELDNNAKKSEIKRIDALERYKKGNYAKCEHCGQEIPYERLELLPYTTVCTECSREEETEEQHSLHREPVEDEILNRPFSRTFNDGTDRVGFDGEDAWQAVARYGTSDSLQDLGTNRDVSDPNDTYEDADEVIGAVQFIETLETQREPEGRINTIHYSKEHGQTSSDS